MEELWDCITMAIQMFKFDMAEMKIAQADPKTTDTQTIWTWRREGFDNDNGISEPNLLKIELPLLNGTKYLGSLWLVKDLKHAAISHHTLRRVEHLRRTIVQTLEELV